MNSQKQKLYITIFLVVFVSLVLIFGGWWFTSTKIVSRFDKLQEARVQEATAAVESTLVASFQKQLSDNAILLESLKERFLQDDEGAIIDFIEQLENLAEATDVELSINSAAPLKEGSAFQLEMNLVGDFDDVVGLLAEIEGNTIVGEFIKISMNGTTRNNVRTRATFILEQFTL